MTALKNASLVLGSILLVLLGVEVSLRAFGAETPSSHPLRAFHRFDPEIGWTGAPDVDRPLQLHFHERPLPGTARVRQNALGLRGEEIPATRTAGRERIVVLGDSFLWGWGVDNDRMFSARLSALTGAEVVTLACSSYGTVQEMLLFERAGAAYRPDVVIVGFYMNDLEDNVDSQAGRRPYGDVDGAGGLVLRNLPVRERLEGPVRVWLYDHSKAALFLGDRWQRLVARIHGENATRPYVPRSLFRDDADFPRKWDVTRAALDRLERSIRGAGAEMVLVAIPHPIQVLPDRRVLDLVDLGRTEHDVDLDRTIAHLASFAEERGPLFLDATAALRDARSEGSEPYNERPEFHWSAAGHDAAARATAAMLTPRSRARRAPRTTAGREGTTR